MNDKKSVGLKAEYLSKLENNLFRYFTQDEVLEILNDYNDFFDSGLQEGKSEQQLIGEFGNPEDIAVRLHNTKSESSIDRVKAKTDPVWLRIMLRILLVTAALLSINLLKNVPDLTWLINNSFVSVLLPLLILFVCLMLYTIHNIFKQPLYQKKLVPLTMSQNLRINKVMLIISYILPIVSSIVIMGGLVHIAYASAPFSELYTSPDMAAIITRIMADTSEISIFITGILVVLLAIREHKFSLMKSGLQIALLSFTYAAYMVLSNLDLNGSFLLAMFVHVKMITCTAALAIIAVVVIHMCIGLLQGKKTPIKGFVAFILIICAISSIIPMSINNWLQNPIIMYISVTLIIALSILFSVYTKRNQNLCFGGKNTDKISLIGLLCASGGAIIISIAAYALSKLLFDVASSSLDSHLTSAVYITLLIISNIIWIAFILFMLVYIVNGKSKSSCRYLCLIAAAPLLVMTELVTLYGMTDTTRVGWQIWYAHDVTYMQKKSIMLCVIIIAIPLLTFAVSKILSVLKAKGEDICRLN